jgi:hypothetical protein
VKVRDRGVEVAWQGRMVDIIVGSVPVNIVLPGTASKMFRMADDAITVRFTGLDPGIELDIWFDVIKEPVRDDY